MTKTWCAGLCAGLFVLLPATASAQLRVVNWNVTNYTGGRVTVFQTAIYGSYQGRSMSPDVFIGQEFISSAAVSSFLNLLNTAPGGPGDWAAASFIDGPDTDSAFFYRTSRVTFLGVTVVAVGGVNPNHPRNIQRYDMRLVGYESAGAGLACYSTHMKAGSSGEDQARRLLEAQRIRNNAETLPAGWSFLLGGDFNIQSSTQSAYQELVGSQANNAGRLFDPILTPGGWNNNGSFRFVHTQDPTGASGMDDRHDQVLISGGLIDGEGFDYVGNPTLPYSTATWNDGNHSYRAWGNDGSSFDVSLTINGNQMVGPTIAQALVDSTNGSGHLPVFLDLRVPPRIIADTLIDFGQVSQDAGAEQTLTVFNDGDVALWGMNGIADLEYSAQATAGFVVSPGPFIDAPGGLQNTHVVEMDTSTIGPMAGTLTIVSNAPDDSEWTVTLTGEVVASAVPGDVDGDGDVDFDDYAAFASCMNGPEITIPPDGCTAEHFSRADLDVDNDVDLVDFGILEPAM